jgi:hypothetical protein
MAEEIRGRLQREHAHKREFGHVKPIVHADFQGHKFVAVGNTLHRSKKWRTFTDFLIDYLKRKLGQEWGQEQMAKPLSERHVIAQWYDALCAFQRGHVRGPDGLFSAVPDGPTLAYLTLAYDLYLIEGDGLLQETVLRRLKHPDQFQGARYELAVAATMMRAGFTVKYEDESDTTRKHPEFTAVHTATGTTVAVEAKSRVRPGVLGAKDQRRQRPGVKPDVGAFRLGIEEQFKKALGKAVAQVAL